jgi:hypothetical protein
LRCAVLFGRGIAGRAERAGILRFVWVEVARDAEVDQVQVASGGTHDVGWLHVAKDDGWHLLMQVAQHFGQRYSYVDGFLRGKALARLCLQIIFQRFAFDVVHYQVPVFGVGKVIVDARQVFMTQFGEQPHFAVIRVGCFDDAPGRERAQIDGLDGDNFVLLPHIPGFEDSSKATLPDLIEDGIAPVEHRALYKRPGCRR